MAYTEGVNFKKSLADLLGLEAGAGIAASLQRIRQLLDRFAAASQFQLKKRQFHKWDLVVHSNTGRSDTLCGAVDACHG